MIRLLNLLIAVTLISTSLTSQVVSGFTTMEPRAACPPILIHYVNQSTGSGTLTYYWDLGNGITSTQKSPSATYSKPGKYSVKLMVTNGVDEDSTVMIDYIEVFVPPTTKYLPNDTLTICAPEEIKYTNTSNVGSSPIIQYTWDFGDGYISFEQNPTHTYSIAGFYTPSLTVKDANGCSSSLTIDNQVKCYKPLANFSSNITESCEGSLLVPFNNLSNGAGKLNYLWNFGDNTTSNLSEPLHSYTNSGNFTVTLQILDNNGCADTIVKSEYIKISAITPTFLIPSDTVCADVSTQFINTTLNSTIYLWNFGDGQTSNQKNPKHTYTQSGEYTVSLFASNGLCGGTSTEKIVVESLKADFLPSGRYLCEVPKSIAYQNKSINASTYDWRFGNGIKSSEKSPTISYILDHDLSIDKKHSYVDTLIITSKRGCKSKMILDSSVVVVLPQAIFVPNSTNGASQLSGCIPLTVNFKDASTYDSSVDRIATYKWQFLYGESKPNRDANEFTEIFTKDTSTVVVFTITTELGCVAQYSEVVSAGFKQTPEFKLINSTNVLCASQEVFFENTSTDLSKISSSTWYWGDGESSRMETSHVYVKTGPMNVRLRVSSNGCVNSITKSNFVTIKGPIALFSDSIDCEKPFERAYNIANIDAKSYSLDLGDGTVIDNQLYIKHTYSKTGDFVVKLKAINEECTSNANPINEHIRDIKSVGEILNSSPCPYSTYSFNASSSIDEVKWTMQNDTALYLWNFGDHSKSIFTRDTVVNHLYTKRGNYKITLVTKDINQCPDTAFYNQQVFKPVSGFTASYLDGCMPIQYEFENTSNADSLSFLTSYKWNFGDGQSSILVNPTHEYKNWGSYTVTLISTDNKSCSDTLIKPGIATALYPNPQFVSSDVTLCVGDSVEFSSIDASKIASYLWTFPDNSTSTLPNPHYRFESDGEFDVQLFVVDKHGCDSLGVQAGYIKVQKPPIVNFLADPLISDCYPTQVTFTDQTISDYLGGWRWSFGDVNGYSYRQNPQHVYTRPGSFDIKLVANTTYGCADSLTKSSYVNPKGPYAEIETMDTICRDASTILKMINPYNVFNYKWDLGDGMVKEASNPISYTYLQVGRFYPGLFLVSDTFHTCDKFIIDTIYVSETLAKYQLDNQNPFGCVPYQVSYTNKSTESNQWTWDFGNNTFSNNFNVIGDYATSGVYTGKLSVRNAMGCTDSVMLNPITVHPLPTVTITPDHFICLNSSTLLEATGGVSYNWSPEADLLNPSSNTTSASPDKTTRYTVLVTDVNGCEMMDSMNLIVQQIPVPPLSDTTIIVGESVALDIASAEIKSYYWEPNYNISCTTCSDPVFQPLVNTIYYLTIKDTADCFTIKTPVSFNIEYQYSVDVPSAFTPNGDGLNDEAFVKGWGIKELITFRIFNKFGVMVFETNDLNRAWNGEGSAGIQPNETFQYIVKVRSYDDSIITKSGSIKILR